MPTTGQSLEVLPTTVAISRLPADAPVPDWAWASREFLTISRSPEELSIAADDGVVPGSVPSQRGYRALRIRGLVPFGSVGILVSLLDPLARAGYAVFAVSTHDTDYLLIRGADFDGARSALERSGHHVLE
jgi:hypothetical protein